MREEAKKELLLQHGGEELMKTGVLPAELPGKKVAW